VQSRSRLKSLSPLWCFPSIGLKEHKACTEGRNWVNRYHPNTEGIELVLILAKHRFDWANWLIVRLLDKQQKVQYAIYAARLVLHIFEEKHPDDNRPRKAIEAAEMDYDTQAAADAANTAGRATAGAASYAAYAAANAAVQVAGNAAYAAIFTIHADAARLAADAAADAAAARDDVTKQDIIDYGIKLITT